MALAPFSLDLQQVRSLLVGALHVINMQSGEGGATPVPSPAVAFLR